MSEHPNTRHGHCRRNARTATYKTWASMIRRCTMPSQDSYPLYGGRGIKVCARWLDSFAAFLADMGERPEGLTLERMDYDGDYSPANCRWATPTEQARNRSANRRITHDGVTLTVAEWSERTAIPSEMIRSRIDRLGWSVAAALTTPPVGRAESLARAKAVQTLAPIAEYVELMKRGESCAQIGARYGITGSGVTKALQRAGIRASDYTQTTEARRARALSHLTGATLTDAVGKIGRRA